MKLTDEQIKFVKENIKGKKVDEEKFLEYLEKNDSVGEEIFEECKAKDDHRFFVSSFTFGLRKNVRGYLPVKTEVFIRRIPFYYYRADRGYSFRSWIADLIRDTEEYEEELEKIYQVLEYLYYEGGVSIDEIMSYIKIQLYGKEEESEKQHDIETAISKSLLYASSWITEEKLLYDWAEYIKICKKIGWNDYFPERFITKYNEALEMEGLSPIIYGFHSKSWLLHLDRERNKISCMGNFPCDGLGRPIMKWIGIRNEKVEGVSCTCVNSRYGELIIQINPESMIYVLNYVDGNGELAEPGEAGTVISWEQQYAGPLNMVFDNEALKEARKAFKMTQKELADAIGTSVRTYQKWENGDTKPDCQSLLRLMNWLEIEDVQYLIAYKSYPAEEEKG